MYPSWHHCEAMNPSMANHPHSHPNPFHQKLLSSALAHHTTLHPLNLTKLLKCQTLNQDEILGHLGWSFCLVHFTYLLSLTIIIQICAHYHTPLPTTTTLIQLHSPLHLHSLICLCFQFCCVRAHMETHFGGFQFSEGGNCGCA